MTPTERLLALHVRLTGDSSNAFESSDGKRAITKTPEGNAWLSDYAKYCELYRSINGNRFVGMGPADLALDAAFGFILEPEAPEPEAA